MKRKNIILSVAFLLNLLLASPMIAQTVNSSYFLDGSFDRHQMNPALTPERAYLSLPVIGGTNINFNGNVGLSHFIYKSKSQPDVLTTFLSSEIDKNSFLKKLPDNTKVNLNVELELLSLGFRALGGYNTFGINFKTRELVSVPKDMFAFMKAGLSDGNYVVENMRVNSLTYIEAALGHSREVIDNLTVGAKLKFLKGGAYADANITELKATVSNNKWIVNTNAEMQVAAPTSDVLTTDEEGLVDGVAENIELGEFSSNGFAVDLGAYYDMSNLVEGLSVSASVTDIGAIKWKNMEVAKTQNEDIVFDGFDDFDIMADNSENEELDNLADDFQDMVQLHKSSSVTKRTNLGATFRVGVEYTMPFAEWISVGELFTYRTGVHKYTESRTAIVLSPLRWFELSGNLAFTSTCGTMLGFMLNIHPAGFNFFIASDGIKAKFNPQFMPVEEFGANLMFGIKVPVGPRLD